MLPLDDPDYPENIEHDLCDKIERDFANILNSKILPQRYKIVLSREELTIVKKYLIISVHRFKYTKKKLFEDGMYEDTFQDVEISDFNKNISRILSCDNDNELMNLRKEYFESILNLLHTNEKIDLQKIAKSNQWKGVNEILGAYLGFLRTDYCKENFIISDIGTSYYFGKYAFDKLYCLINLIRSGCLSSEDMDELMSIAWGTSPMDYSIFPIANNMAIICWSPFLKMYEQISKFNMINSTVYEHIGFGSKETISSPKVKEINGKRTYIYSVKQITNKDLHHLNYLLLEEADKYIAFADYNKIKPSVEYAEKQTQKKRDFSYLLKLNKAIP